MEVVGACFAPVNVILQVWACLPEDSCLLVSDDYAWGREFRWEYVGFEDVRDGDVCVCDVV